MTDISTATVVVNGWLASLHPELQLNDQGFCTLANDQVALVAEVTGTTGQCHLSAVVMPPPEEPAALVPWMQEALRLNLSGRPLLGAWLAYDPELSTLFLCQNLPLDRTTAEEFQAVANTMVETVKAVRERLTPDAEAVEDLVGESFLAAE
ncbi:MAG TPA: type III secretion system chaperone [Prosthecobacter sp.]